MADSRSSHTSPSCDPAFQKPDRGNEEKKLHTHTPPSVYERQKGGTIEYPVSREKPDTDISSLGTPFEIGTLANPVSGTGRMSDPQNQYCNSKLLSDTPAGIGRSALSVPKKTIVLMGKTGVGKDMVARHIFQNPHIFPDLTTLESITRQPILRKFEVSNTWHLNQPSMQVFLLDTNQDSFMIKRHSASIKSVNAIFFVLRHGRAASEDCRSLELIMDGIQELADVCHLVITGCEGIDQAGRSKVIELYESDQLTSGICAFVKGKIYPVGFPNTTTINPVIKKLYQEGIQNDSALLQKIVKDSCLQSPQKILLKKHENRDCFIF